jgi:hypothetical protein
LKEPIQSLTNLDKQVFEFQLRKITKDTIAAFTKLNKKIAASSQAQLKTLKAIKDRDERTKKIVDFQESNLSQLQSLMLAQTNSLDSLMAKTLTKLDSAPELDDKQYFATFAGRVRDQYQEFAAMFQESEQKALEGVTKSVTPSMSKKQAQAFEKQIEAEVKQSEFNKRLTQVNEDTPDIQSQVREFIKSTEAKAKEKFAGSKSAEKLLQAKGKLENEVESFIAGLIEPFQDELAEVSTLAYSVKNPKEGTRLKKLQSYMEKFAEDSLNSMQLFIEEEAKAVLDDLNENY